jgi:carboxymethylenebutenolidase
MGETIKVKAADGHEFDAYRTNPSGKPRGALVVIQEIFGVNSHIQEVCDGFAKDGYATISPAVFDRVQRGVSLGYQPDDIAQGRELRGQTGDENAGKDIAACIKTIAGAVGPDVKIGIVGYCWGGTLSWQAACRADGLSAAVCYYGGQIADSKDEAPKCPVLMHFGETDAQIPMDMVDSIRKAHPEIPMHVYPGAGHGFSCDHRGSYHADSAKVARERTMAFFAEHLG